MSPDTLTPKDTQGVVSLAQFIEKKVSNFADVQKGNREDWGQDSVKIIFHKENFSNFLLDNINKIIPITFEAWPSLSCDARCPLCAYSINNARSEDDKSGAITLAKTSMFGGVIEKLAIGGVRSITLTGGGEPLLNPKIDLLIREIEKNGMKWGMFTHGLHLRGSIRRAILGTPPKFLRVSLNSSSPETHAQEYRMGIGAYDQILENIVNFALEAQNLPISLGVGYAVDPKTNNDELTDIAHCLAKLRDATQGRVNYASFRPKVVYYNRDGSPRYTQVRHDEFADLPARILQSMQDVLGPIRQSGIRLDIKHHQFQNITDRRVFQNGLGLSWVSQIDHLGKGFLLSELNGSPWPDATYGSYTGSEEFTEIWFGKRRLELTQLHQSGRMKVPLNLKTAHVDYLLEEIRSRFGVLSQRQVDTFWQLPEMQNLNPPKNWDFL